MRVVTTYATPRLAASAAIAVLSVFTAGPWNVIVRRGSLHFRPRSADAMTLIC